MSLSVEAVANIPIRTGRRGPRASFTRDVIDAVDKSYTKRVSVKGSDRDEVESFYKALIQYRIRHEMKTSLNVQKDGLTVYVWRPERQPLAVSGQRRSFNRF
jgi:hypothetical protein